MIHGATLPCAPAPSRQRRGASAVSPRPRRRPARGQSSPSPPACCTRFHSTQPAALAAVGRPHPAHRAREQRQPPVGGLEAQRPEGDRLDLELERVRCRGDRARLVTSPSSASRRIGVDVARSRRARRRAGRSRRRSPASAGRPTAWVWVPSSRCSALHIQSTAHQSRDPHEWSRWPGPLELDPLVADGHRAAHAARDLIARGLAPGVRDAVASPSSARGRPRPARPRSPRSGADWSSMACAVPPSGHPEALSGSRQSCSACSAGGLDRLGVVRGVGQRRGRRRRA